MIEIADMTTMKIATDASKIVPNSAEEAIKRRFPVTGKVTDFESCLRKSEKEPTLSKVVRVSVTEMPRKVFFQ